MGSGISSAPPAYAKRAESTPAAMVVTSLYTFTHGLGGRARGVRIWMECAIAEAGYAVGDRVACEGFYDAAVRGAYAVIDSDTVVKVRFATMNGTTPDKGTGAASVITAANWNIVIEAWR